jgi:hypothetical protein
MGDVVVILLGLFGGLALVGGVAYVLQRRATMQGALFAGPASPTLRILALLLGLLFAGFFVVELLYADSIHIVIPVLAVALIAYSLGAGRLLKGMQGGEEQDHEG